MRRFKKVSPDELRTHDLVRIGRKQYRVQWIEWPRPSQAWVVVYGPIGSQTAQGGQAIYAGSKPLRKTNLLGERETLQPAELYVELNGGAR